MIVWTLTGIWHGASWNFLFWGLYYALLLILEKIFLYDRLQKAPKWIGHVYAMFLVVVGWVLFSVEDLPSCIAYLRSMFFGGAGFCSATFLYYLRSFAPGLLIMIVASTPLAGVLYRRLPEKLKHVLEPILILASLLLCTAYLVDSTYNPFLYFRF